MPSIADRSLQCQGNIMVVDDNPANLKLLEDMLRQHAYEVRSFPRGRLALAAADQAPPDLMLLDVNMPEMNGYEVCEKLKSNPLLSGIPVIFISALNAIEDKVKGFQSGGVDYISKPFQFEEVHGRLEIHLKLRRAQQAEHELLEKTLSGAIGTLWELVQLTSPELAQRSHAIRDIVLWIIKRMGIKDSWEYELAATLCLMGCMALPDEVFERAYCGQTLTPDEDRMFRSHPETACRLLSKIPRLEGVAEMIRGLHKPRIESSAEEHSRQGANLLQLAFELDRRIYRGATPSSALSGLRSLGRFEGRMLDALENYIPAKVGSELRRLPIRDLRIGMVLEKDVVSTTGSLVIFKQGTVLTETWIDRLANFAKSLGVEEPIDVRIP